MIARARRAVIYRDLEPLLRDAFARKNHDYLAVCSCWMCGNPRRFEGERTLQERRSDLTRFDDLR
jgi:hypothetical protein